MVAFLNITSAFDNVIPSILLQELRKLEIPACTYKFIENLLCERYTRFVWDGVQYFHYTQRNTLRLYSQPYFIQYLFERIGAIST